MPYFLIEDFKYGMDRRRPRHAGTPGTLWSGKNVVISRGGDIERCKAFVPIHTGLGSTFGLEQVAGRQYVFGSADLAGSMPAGVEYQRLQAPGAPAMTAILDTKRFDNLIYAIAEYDNGNRYHFYDGVRVAEWDTVADNLASRRLLAQELARVVSTTTAATAVPIENGLILTARTAGVGYTITGSHTNGGAGVDDQTITIANLVANVAPVDEVRATAAFTITGGTFDPNVNTIASLRVGATLATAIDILPGPVSYNLSDTAMATAIALAVNDRTDEHGYSAATAGAQVTITAAPGFGASANGLNLYVTTSGDVTTSGGAVFAGGVDAVAAVAQSDRVILGGTFEPLDTVLLTINGVDYRRTGRAAATPARAHIQHNRVFAPIGPALYYCALNDPTDWTDTAASIGAGLIGVSTDSDGAQDIIGIAEYSTLTAVFSNSATVIYALGTDAALFERVQSLDNSGTISGRSVLNYGAIDLFYLDTTGIRSLRARDSSEAAFVSDAGTAFDPFVQETIATLPPGVVQNSTSVIQPDTGAYWLALGSRILVLTNYPGADVRAWTYIEPGFTPDTFLRDGPRLFVRDATTIYAYGGLSGTTYPAANQLVAEVKLPFATAKDAAGFKTLIGFDIAAANEWAVKVLVNPSDETQQVDAGRFVGVTYQNDNAEIIHETTHMALDMTCDKAGAGTISNVAIHYKGALRA
jgi:hypothetical protein